MVFSDNNEQDENAWESFLDEIQLDKQKAQRELEEITLMLEQSQIEVNKLAQRNAAVNSRLQHIHNLFDSTPRSDIREAYDTALDTQQRLFVMRGQLEKLQNDQSHLNNYISIIGSVIDNSAFTSGSGESGSSASAFGTVEAIIQAQEAERQRLSRQMHDGPAQALSNFILQTEIAMRLFDMDQDQAKEELNNLKHSATATFQKVRDFIFELRPMMLDDLGLVPTLKRYVEAFKEQNNIEVNLAVSGVERRMESYIEVLIFRAIQELLGNAVRLSQATIISVNLDISDILVKVGVEDNGKGFDSQAELENSFMGIKVIKERVDMLGGKLDLDTVLGQGSQIRFQLPAGPSTQSVFA